eukprot:scaffold133237_cov41-Attheya_sp.AAC.5
MMVMGFVGLMMTTTGAAGWVVSGVWAVPSGTAGWGATTGANSGKKPDLMHVLTTTCSTPEVCALEAYESNYPNK